VLLDWFTVTYRSVYLAGGALLLVLLVAGGAWYYRSVYRPRAEASAAMARATKLLSEVAAHRAEPRVEELLRNARAALEEAREAFEARRYRDALFAAQRSEDLSARALDLAKGSRGSAEVRFYRLEGDVRVKRAGEFAWEPADPKMTLRIGDQVKTSGSASAQLVYFDGTITTVQPGSLLEIRQLHEDPATRVRRVSEKLDWGEVVASTQKRNVDGSYHEVATEQVAARTGDAGRFRVAYDRDEKTSRFDVFEGRVEVSSPDRKESLSAGERIEATAQGKLSTKEVLPGVPRLLSPSDERVFVYEDPARANTTLSWEKVPGAARYRLLVSDKPLFTRPLADTTREETSIEVEAIPPGYYYWKVAAISASGVEGPFSESRSFRVTTQRVRDRRDTEGPKIEITDRVQTGPMLILNGRTEPGALLWIDAEKVDVYDDGTFYAVIRLRKEGWNELKIVAQDAAGNETRMVQRAYVEGY